MTKAELEDLIKLHNAEVDMEYEELHEQWRRLRFEESIDQERLKSLRKQMDTVRNERVELKDEA
jgi:predicted nuclease with TOPRIM domain